MYKSDQADWNEMSDIIRFDFRDRPDRDDPTKIVRVKVGRKDATTYFARMSTAMALLCSGTVHSLHKDLDKIPLTGIFRQVELATLQDKIARNRASPAPKRPVTDVNN